MEPRQTTNSQRYRPNRQLRRQEIEQLVEDYKAGASISELAARFHIHRKTVMHHLGHAGFVTREQTRKITSEVLADMVEQYEAGVSTYELAKQYDVAPRSVGRALKAAGVTMRRARKFNL